LRSRQPITLTKPMELPKAKRASTRREGDIECDEILFERLRALRKKLADERGVPAYIVFGDATLRGMAREYPESEDALSGIPGIGEKKLAEFGPAFLEEIGKYLEANAKVTF
jgi:ATP-dependent DNA helicase RecQ